MLGHDSRPIARNRHRPERSPPTVGSRRSMRRASVAGDAAPGGASHTRCNPSMSPPSSVRYLAKSQRPFAAFYIDGLLINPVPLARLRHQRWGRIGESTPGCQSTSSGRRKPKHGDVLRLGNCRPSPSQRNNRAEAHDAFRLPVVGPHHIIFVSERS